jgi:multidrug efflux pump
MAIILVTQFNSFYSAFLILSAVIMSTVGVMLGLLITDQPFGIVMAGIGVIALAGIVVNNNIVLIDTFDRLKKTAPNPHEAILRTGAQRLRPVLLTTITTVLGLMPMVLGINVDMIAREVQMGAPSTQWWRQLATAIAFGLSFATVLTLVVTPSALMLRENLAAWRRRRRGITPPPAAAVQHLGADLPTAAE